MGWHTLMDWRISSVSCSLWSFSCFLHRPGRFVPQTQIKWGIFSRLRVVTLNNGKKALDLILGEPVIPTKKPLTLCIACLSHVCWHYEHEEGRCCPGRTQRPTHLQRRQVVRGLHSLPRLFRCLEQIFILEICSWESSNSPALARTTSYSFSSDLDKWQLDKCALTSSLQSTRSTISDTPLLSPHKMDWIPEKEQDTAMTSSTQDFRAVYTLSSHLLTFSLF